MAAQRPSSPKEHASASQCSSQYWSASGLYSGITPAPKKRCAGQARQLLLQCWHILSVLLRSFFCFFFIPYDIFFAKRAPRRNNFPRSTKSDVRAASRREAGRAAAANAGWADSLSSSDQAEWLIDCYRMRLEDDSDYGGCNWHGMNDPDATQDSITEDFLIFCKLAVLHQVIPPDWDWSRFLRKAAKRLHYHFDKGDAVSKWVCAVSLRRTAEVVYGVGMLGPGRGGMLWSGGDDGVALQRITEQVQGKWRQLVKVGKDAVFEDVGGVQAWKKLHSKLHFQRD